MIARIIDASVRNGMLVVLATVFVIGDGRASELPAAPRLPASFAMTPPYETL